MKDLKPRLINTMFSILAVVMGFGLVFGIVGGWVYILLHFVIKFW